MISTRQLIEEQACSEERKVLRKYIRRLRVSHEELLDQIGADICQSIIEYLDRRQDRYLKSKRKARAAQ